MLNDVFITSNRAKGLAKHLRKRMTSGEALLWQKLRDYRLDGYKFRRQVPLGPYIADFLCVEKKLIIEIDGASHGFPEAQRHDQVRSEYFQAQHFTVIRFRNDHVQGSIDDVLERIRIFVSVL
jgi:very-short-patch-repair endonuclease